MPEKEPPKWKKVLNFFKQSFREFTEDDAPQKAAALAFYTVLSIAPMLVIATAIAGFIYGERAVRGELSAQIEAAVGPESAVVVERMVAQASNIGAGIIATIIGVALLFWGAARVFLALQSSLHKMWNVEEVDKGWRGNVRDKLRSFAMVFGIGVFLLALLFISTAVSAVANVAGDLFPIPPWSWELLNNLLAFLLLTGAFAALFRFLPDVDLAWKDVGVGAAITALLFVLGQWLVGIYLARAGVASTMGAAGAFAIFLLWIYYMAQVVLLGAEMTKVYAEQFGEKQARAIRPPAQKIMDDGDYALPT